MNRALAENEVFDLLRQKDVLLRAGCTEEVKRLEVLIGYLQAAHGATSGIHHEGEAPMTIEQLENLTSKATDVADIALEITGTLQHAFDTLIARRDRQFAEAVKPLDVEAARLEAESADLLGQRDELLRLLDARRRVSQYESDSLLLSGKDSEAKEKLEEMKLAEAAPAAMRARQEQIANRLTAIEEEKRFCACRVFEGWDSECRSLIRILEHELFIRFLDGLWSEYLAFEAKTCPQRSLNEVPMVRSNHKSSLTADERSPEWNSASRWYTGRGRR